MDIPKTQEPAYRYQAKSKKALNKVRPRLVNELEDFGARLEGNFVFYAPYGEAYCAVIGSEHVRVESPHQEGSRDPLIEIIKKVLEPSE
jgi:hypothetical protein